jgi:ribosomal protein S18 acetylase RimI-like enzyme
MRHRQTIRAATVRDVPMLSRLLQLLGYPVHDGPVRASLEALFRDRRHAVAVAEVDGAVAGLLALAVRPSLSLGGWVGTVEALVVAREARNQGVGRALVQYAKGLAVERGVVRLEVPVSEAHAPTAKAFLLASGFESGEMRTFHWGTLEAKNPRVPVVARAAVPAMS